MRLTRPVGSGPGCAVRKRIASGCLNCALHELVGQLLAERHPQLHLDQVDAGRPADEVGHLAARDPRRALDDEHAPVGMRDQLREGDARLQAERVHGVRRDALRLFELVAVDGRRVDVDPADAEPDAGRAQAVRERQGDRLAAAREHDPVHLHPLDELLEDRLAARRRGERLVQVRVDVVDRLDAEDTALAARVGGLEHRREADLVGRAAALRERAHRGEPGLRHAGVGEPRAHRDLVRHQVRGLVPIPGSPRASATAATIGTARSALTVRTPSSLRRAVAFSTASTSEKSTTFAMSASFSPSASGLLSTAATRSPSSFARRIARR